MRDYVDNLKGNPRKGTLKDDDRPDGENGPTVSYSELLKYIEGNERSEAKEDSEEYRHFLNILDIMKDPGPELKKYEDRLEPGRYFIEGLLNDKDLMK